MSTRAARWLLWLALVLMVPVPVMTGVVTALVPAARILMLAGVCLLVVVLDAAAIRARLRAEADLSACADARPKARGRAR